MRKTSIEKTCPICKKKFKFYLSYSAINRGYYCSQKCYFKARWGEDRKISIQCPTCGKHFISFMSDQKKYCSKECYWKSGAPKIGGRKRIKRKCDWCGKEFERPPSNFHSKHFFCSHSCSAFWWSHYGLKGIKHPRWKGGTMPKAYRTQWQRARKAAFSMAGNICKLCGKRGIRLMVHHKIPITKFDNPREANQLDNLIVICYKCHRKIHG